MKTAFTSQAYLWEEEVHFGSDLPDRIYGQLLRLFVLLRLLGQKPLLVTLQTCPSICFMGMRTR